MSYFAGLIDTRKKKMDEELEGFANQGMNRQAQPTSMSPEAQSRHDMAMEQSPFSPSAGWGAVSPGSMRKVNESQRASKSAAQDSQRLASLAGRLSPISAMGDLTTGMASEADKPQEFKSYNNMLQSMRDGTFHQAKDEWLQNRTDRILTDTQDQIDDLQRFSGGGSNSEALARRVDYLTGQMENLDAQTQRAAGSITSDQLRGVRADNYKQYQDQIRNMFGRYS